MPNKMSVVEVVLYRIASLLAGVGAGFDVNSQYQNQSTKETVVANGGKDNASYLDPECEFSSSHVPVNMHNTYHGPAKHHRPPLLFDLEDSKPLCFTESPQHVNKSLTRRRKSSTTSTENIDHCQESSDSHLYLPLETDPYASSIHVRDSHAYIESSPSYISGRASNHRRTSSNISNSSSCSNAGYLEEPPIDYYNSSSLSFERDRRRMAGDYGLAFHQVERPITLDVGHNPRLRSSLKKYNYSLPSATSPTGTPTHPTPPDSLNSDDSNYVSAKDSSCNSVSRVRFSPMRLPSRDSSRSRSRKASVERDYLT